MDSVKIDIRELKHRRSCYHGGQPKLLSADVAYLNTSCGRGDRHGGLQAAFCLRVGLSELQFFFLSKEWLQVNNLLTITFKNTDF